MAGGVPLPYGILQVGLVRVETPCVVSGGARGVHTLGSKKAPPQRYTGYARGGGRGRKGKSKQSRRWDLSRDYDDSATH